MKLTLTDKTTGGDLLLISGEQEFDRYVYGRDNDKKYFTIAWNKGPGQQVHVDGARYQFETHTILPLMFNQSFRFEHPDDIVAWQFNREFYCVIDNDAEVSCAGFLFGLGEIQFLNLDEPDQAKVKLLMDIFRQELNTPDHIQRDMLIMLLKRLIIMITQLARSRYVPESRQQDQRHDLFRKFNVLVERKFRECHSVNFYAEMLNKSPKTLANMFAIYHDKTPLQVIQARIVLEAKRLLYYTQRSVKEITYELGFDDPAYFSNFFKRHVHLSPNEFRNTRMTSSNDF